MYWSFLNRSLLVLSKSEMFVSVRNFNIFTMNLPQKSTVSLLSVADFCLLESFISTRQWHFFFKWIKFMICSNRVYSTFAVEIHACPLSVFSVYNKLKRGWYMVATWMRPARRLSNFSLETNNIKAVQNLLCDTCNGIEASLSWLAQTYWHTYTHTQNNVLSLSIAESKTVLRHIKSISWLTNMNGSVVVVFMKNRSTTNQKINYSRIMYRF